MKRDDVLAAIAVAIFWTSSAQAQERPMAGRACDRPADVAEFLKNRFDEELVGWGVDRLGKRLTQLFASADGETWSIVVRYAGQNACLVAGGARWNTIPDTPGEQAWLRAR